MRNYQHLRIEAEVAATNFTAIIMRAIYVAARDAFLDQQIRFH
jgi:hypothetical protein